MRSKGCSMWGREWHRFYAWRDNSGAPESALTQDQFLDNIMLYWLPNTGAASARLFRYGAYATNE